MTVQEAPSLSRPLCALLAGGSSARAAFAALVEHLGARYRYSPAFARLDGPELEQALVDQAEALCQRLVQQPARLAATTAFGWGRLDRWIRSHWLSGAKPAPATPDDEHVYHRAAQDLILAFAEDLQWAPGLRGAVIERPLPDVLDAALSAVPEPVAPAVAPWQLWVTTTTDGLALWAMVVEVGSTLEGLLTRDGGVLAEQDEIVFSAEETGLEQELVVAPWCRRAIDRARLDRYVLSVSPHEIPDESPPASRAIAELRRYLSRLF